MGTRVRSWAALIFLGLLGLGEAQNPCSTTTTLTKLELPSAVADCTAWTGDIVFERVSPTASTGVTFSTLSILSGNLRFAGASTAAAASSKGPVTIPTTTPVRKVNDRAVQSGGGNQDATNPKVTINAPALDLIAGELSFTDLDWDINPEFSSLSTAYDLIFQNVEFASGTTKFGKESFSALKNAKSFTFDGTNVAAIDLKMDVGAFGGPIGPIASIAAKNNPELQTISLSGLDLFSSVVVDIGANSFPPSVEFPDLKAASLNLAGVGAFDASALTMLATQSDLAKQTIASNLFTALKPTMLNTIQGTLEIASNPNLEDLDFSGLTNAGNMKVFGNTALKTITVGPSATGDITVDSAGPFNCKKLSAQAPDATVSCPSGTSTALISGAPTVPTAGGPTSGSSSGGGLSTGAKAGIGVGVAIGVLILLGAIFFFCIRRRKSSNNTREVSTGAYSKSPHSFGGSDDVTYTKVPYHSGSQGEMRQPHQEYGQHSMMATGWSHAEQNVKPADRTVELEEQQGMRHEMDARSLPDMDSDEDEEAETRSLEDIERVHQQR